jgi:hypothetical protein
LAAAERERDQADDYYEQALGPVPAGDAERSEIRARALYRRGLSRRAGGQVGAAIHDLEEASRIWGALDEHRSAAAPAWEAICLDTALPPALLQHLEREAVEVRVAAVDVYRRRLSACKGNLPRPLAQASREACEQCITEAREWVAVHIIDW